MAVEFCVERKEPRKVAALRIDRRGCLAGDLRYEVCASECPEAMLALRKELRNIMLLIMCLNEVAFRRAFRNRSPAPDRLSET
jgi:hypothetical protein